jgi:hypothetical protein
MLFEPAALLAKYSIQVRASKVFPKILLAMGNAVVQITVNTFQGYATIPKSCR